MVAKRLLVLLLVWGFTPGLAEVTENVWHLVAAGHGAHAVAEGADHAPVGDEHGCSGTFHLCSCHHSLASDLVPLPVSLRAGAPPRELADPGAVPALEPPLFQIEHPPRLLLG